MEKDQIGFNAGKIWQKLEKDLTDTNIKKIKRELKMNSMELGAALGWLARENKITFVSDEKAMYVFPVE
jgi:hypothetical protein